MTLKQYIFGVDLGGDCVKTLCEGCYRGKIGGKATERKYDGIYFRD